MGLTISLLLTVTALVSWLTHRNQWRFVSPLCDRNRARMLCYSPSFSFVSLICLETFFLFSLIYWSSLSCVVVFIVLSRYGELQKLYIHTVHPCFSTGSASFRLIAVVSLVLTMSLPACTRKDHKSAVVMSHSS